ncbi:hypothetical protein HDU96_005285, partial [Phlyctochytrium bullatum]
VCSRAFKRPQDLKKHDKLHTRDTSAPSEKEKEEKSTAESTLPTPAAATQDLRPLASTPPLSAHTSPVPSNASQYGRSPVAAPGMPAYGLQQVQQNILPLSPNDSELSESMGLPTLSPYSAATDLSSSSPNTGASTIYNIEPPRRLAGVQRPAGNIGFPSQAPAFPKKRDYSTLDDMIAPSQVPSTILEDFVGDVKRKKVEATYNDDVQNRLDSIAQFLFLLGNPLETPPQATSLPPPPIVQSNVHSGGLLGATLPQIPVSAPLAAQPTVPSTLPPANAPLPITFTGIPTPAPTMPNFMPMPMTLNNSDMPWLFPTPDSIQNYAPSLVGPSTGTGDLADLNAFLDQLSSDIRHQEQALLLNSISTGLQTDIGLNPPNPQFSASLATIHEAAAKSKSALPPSIPPAMSYGGVGVLRDTVLGPYPITPQPLSVLENPVGLVASQRVIDPVGGRILTAVPQQKAPEAKETKDEVDALTKGLTDLKLEKENGSSTASSEAQIKAQRLAQHKWVVEGLKKLIASRLRDAPAADVPATKTQ